MVNYCLDRYKIQEMCDKTVDAFPPTLNFFLNWFLASKMIKKLDGDLFVKGDIIFVNEDYNNVTFFSDELHILSVDLININLDDINFEEDDPETIVHVRLMAWCNRFKQRKAYKKGYKQRIITCSMTSYKMVGLVRVRR